MKQQNLLKLPSISYIEDPETVLQPRNFMKKLTTKDPTVVIIDITAGNKFGGYAAVSRASVGDE